MAHKTENQAVGIATALTVHQPVSLGSVGLFAVQGGVPLSEAMDTMALALKVAARMIEDGELDKRVAKRYAGWNGELGQQILKGQMNLADIARYATQHDLAPQHQSGHQELLENVVNRYLFDR